MLGCDGRTTEGSKGHRNPGKPDKETDETIFQGCISWRNKSYEKMSRCGCSKKSVTEIKKHRKKKRHEKGKQTGKIKRNTL
uniref:Uncharacterized protein n=1 Tax=Anopheles atroparvus TaxID=41427 RepID=A0AAG5DAP7_ANOAO